MNVEQRKWTKTNGWVAEAPGKLKGSCHLLLLFGAPSALKKQKLLDDLKRTYPEAHFFGCSTAGEISGTQVLDDSLVATAVHFDRTKIRGVKVGLESAEGSLEAGERLGRELTDKDLVHVLMLSEGLNVNGSDLVKGITRNLPRGVSVTGGLSGDGGLFKETWVVYDAPPERNTIAAIGFYGDRLRVGYASLGGWDPFGPERLITRSKGNVLYELDGHSALDLYKNYLGEHSKGLPATGLFFPLSLRTKDGGRGVVRTILSIDEKAQSMTFAGDVPERSYARLMRANFDRLIDGAVGAAKTSYEAVGSFSPDLAVLISCVGRKLVLKQRIEEEVEGVREILGEGTVLTGFYSYGEISPFTPKARCELHNQTMTITTFAER